MQLNCVNIATTNIIEMRDFYSLVLNAPYKEIVQNRFEIPAGGVSVVITPTNVKTPVNPDSCGLEFIVDDVDEEYKRLIAAGVTIENPPVTYPWNWRAVEFKDPDGNNIDFVKYMGE